MWKLSFCLLLLCKTVTVHSLQATDKVGGKEKVTYTDGFIPGAINFKSKDVKKSGQVKRSPLTASWANLLYKPAQLRQKQKKSALPSPTWGNQWENVLRSPQGFRLNDADRHYLTNAVMYKRGMRHVQELNSVPMLGKRDADVATKNNNAMLIDPEFWKYVDDKLLKQDYWNLNEYLNNAKQAEEDASNEDLDYSMDENNQLTDSSLMGNDAALYTPSSGTHYRTILTRIQRSKPQDEN